MSKFDGFGFDDAPVLNFVEEALGQNRLAPELIQPYYAEAIETAARICTDSIARYLSGCLEYNRATSKPTAYRDGILIGLGLTAGPAALYDDRVIELVELGLFIPDDSNSLKFRTLAELKEDQVKTGGLMKPCINRPEDLDSFMRGLRYIAQQST